MSKYFKIVLSVLIITIASSVVVIYLYNKPFIDMAHSKADFIFSAQVILNDFQENEDSANKKYVDRILQVSGEIVEISINKKSGIITLKDVNSTSSIICHMRPKDFLNIDKFNQGDRVMVKGICTGYLLDVIMVRCVIVNDYANEK